MRKILFIFFVALAAFCLVKPTIYWANHAELSQMEVLIDNWRKYVVGLFALLVVLYLYLRDE